MHICSLPVSEFMRPIHVSIPSPIQKFTTSCLLCTRCCRSIWKAAILALVSCHCQLLALTLYFHQKEIPKRMTLVSLVISKGDGYPNLPIQKASQLRKSISMTKMEALVYHCCKPIVIKITQLTPLIPNPHWQQHLD